MFGKVLVANRGEIAVRIIRALEELGIASVAVYSEADRDALHVAARRRGLSAGPAGADISTSTADRGRARESGAEAVHPGYGFLAENAAFAQALRGGRASCSSGRRRRRSRRWAPRPARAS